MPLIRSESQGGGDVKEFYIAKAEYSERVQEICLAMNDLVDALNTALPTTKVWGLTSHFRLGLMSVPEYDKGIWHVWVDNVYGDRFYMGYNPPEPLPVEDAYVSFGAKGVSEAVAKIKAAMRESGGWPSSSDLAQ